MNIGERIKNSVTRLFTLGRKRGTASEGDSQGKEKPVSEHDDILFGEELPAVSAAPVPTAPDASSNAPVETVETAEPAATPGTGVGNDAVEIIFEEAAPPPALPESTTPAPPPAVRVPTPPVSPAPRSPAAPAAPALKQPTFLDEFVALKKQVESLNVAELRKSISGALSDIEEAALEEVTNRVSQLIIKQVAEPVESLQKRLDGFFRWFGYNG